jgi:predicted ester cyclase
MLSPDAKGHLEGGQEIVGPDEFVIFHRELLAAMPDLTLEILRMIAENEYVCIHWQVKGTHTGRGFGLPPTGRDLPFSGMSLFHVQNGKVVEGWDCWNQARVTASMAGA